MMNNFLSIIKGDYLQRTRSYAFLVTLAISLLVAYTFVPAPDASYTTLRIGDFVGEYNSAWIGYVSAIMTSVFLSLFGFYLINSGIKKDIETEVGMIIATTQVSNFKYLLSKTLSNFLVLLTIVAIVFLISIGIFFLRSSGFSFEVSYLIRPYLFVVVPSVFFISCLAVVFEVVLGRWSVIQNIAFFALFNMMMANVQINRSEVVYNYIDPFGVNMVTNGIEDFVRVNYDENARIKSMGFIFGRQEELKYFVFEGFHWSPYYIISRVGWMLIGLTLVFGSSLFFHRFDVKEKVRASKKAKLLVEHPVSELKGNIKIAALPAFTVDYGIMPFIKTELLMLIRRGPRYLWFVNAGLVIALIFTPLEVAHSFILPILWFFQVGRISDLVTKEKTHFVHYFTYAAYQPVKRLLTAQVVAGICLTLALALPLLLRYIFAGLWLPAAGIIAGAIFIIVLSTILGMLSGGKKLFEVLFFAIAYINLNQIPEADYFGSSWTTVIPLVILFGLISSFAIISVLIRSYEIRTN
jgi:hypothetical protein